MEPEEIPDEDFLFRRVPHWSWNFDENQVAANAFNDPRMSVDWKKYSTIDETIERDGQPQDGSIFGAVMLKTGFCRRPDDGKQDRAQIVRHAPRPKTEQLPENAAHAEVIGEKTLGLARKFVRHAMAQERKIPPKRP